MNNQNKTPNLFFAIFTSTAIDQTIMDQWRAPFLRSVMQVTTILGLIPMIAGALSVNNTLVAATYIGAYLVLAGITFLPIPYWLRASVFLVILYALGLVELLYLGILGDSALFFMPLIIMATLLYSPKVGTGATSLTLLTLLVVGWLMLTGQITPGNEHAVQSSLSDWVSAGAIFIMLSLFIIQALRLLENDLSHFQQESLNSINLLKNQQETLETRVVDRTRALEQNSFQIETAASIARDITTIRDLNTLLGNAVGLISQRFGYYHAGIFLLDEYSEYAVLTAANSEGGRNMLQNGHRLKVGETSIVGFVTQNGQARIASDVGADTVYFDNPYLPETRSEMALPIIASGQILGALDVQTKETHAFSEGNIKTLQVLADQLAIAIQNARLFEQSEAALEAARRAYAETSSDAWKRHIKSEAEIGYIATQGSVQAISSQWNDDLLAAVETGDIKVDDYERVVNIPVKVRGQSIGAIRLRKQEANGSWTKDETGLALAFADQLSSALETARLYQEAQQRAIRESIVSDISSRISTSPSTENVLRDTIMELSQAIGNVSVTFQLIAETDSGNQAEGPESGENVKSASAATNEKRVKE